MDILLDTKVWLWMNQNPEKLSQNAKEVIQNSENNLYLSAASAWELSVKNSLGILSLHMSPEKYVTERMADNDIKALAISHKHTLRAMALPNHHEDPFDRILVAQSLSEHMPILTVDRRMKKYRIDVIWGDT